MNILLIDTGDEEITSVKREFEILGNQCKIITKEYKPINPFVDDWKKNTYEDLDLGEYDIVFTTTYLPGLAKRCAEYQKYYFAWVLHMPCIGLYSDTVVLPTNRIFCLDMNQASLFQGSGIQTVFYLPYAVDVTDSDSENRTGVAVITELDIAERHGVYGVLANTKDSTKGYLDGMAAAQMAIYPDLILPKLPAYVMDDIAQNLQTVELTNNMATTDWIIREYLLLDMITARERLVECSEITRYDNITFYINSKITTEGIKQEKSPGNSAKKQIEIYSQHAMALSMPKRAYYNCLYKETLKIMAGGAMALSPYSAELAESFVQGQNILMYTNDNEFKYNMHAYSQDEAKCIEIGKRGQEAVRNEHNFAVRVRDMLSTI